MAVFRLAARLYAAANVPLGAELIACLVRPLGPLSLLAIAGGAFSVLLRRDERGAFRVVIDGAVRFSRAQVAELAAFAQQVNPKALEHFAGTLASNRIEIAAFSTTAVMLLLRELNRAGIGRSGTAGVGTGTSLPQMS